MKKHLLNNKTINDLLINDPIVVLDGGARGELFKPFNGINSEIVKVLKFEADPGATIVNTKNEIVVPKALFDKTGTVTLNVAFEPTASSVFPFNRELQKYIDPYSDKRNTQESVSVECTSLDEFCKEHSINNVDFIKLDIHGCEFEVLNGSKNALKNTIGLLVENWILPIHKGQHTRGHIESFLYEKQFYMFEEYVQSAWRRMGKKYTKRQPVTIDTLYFKDPLIDKNISSESQAIKLIGIAELFKHYGFAWQLADEFHKKEVINNELFNVINKHFNKYNQTSLLEKIKDKFIQYFIDKTNKQSFK